MFIKFRVIRLLNKFTKNPLIILKIFNLKKFKREFLNLFNQEINFINLEKKLQIELLFFSIKKLNKISNLEKNKVPVKIFAENSLNDFYLKYKDDENCKKFINLFTKYGSDKTISKLSYLYWEIINKKKIKNLFEVGLGTNNISIPGNMGFDGKPGASARAFGEYLNEANIVSGDIDKEILFQEKNIKTFFIDQLDINNLNEIKLSIPKQCLIIDDGLGRPNSNLNMISEFCDHLAKDGYLVIEHIDILFRDIYQNCINILTKNNNFQAQIIEGHGITFVIKKI